MARQAKAPSGWGELNVALNAVVKSGVIRDYRATGADGDTVVEVTVDSGADQAEVVRQVREALPGAFASAKVRTRAG
jgi:hypothetical protein